MTGWHPDSASGRREGAGESPDERIAAFLATGDLDELANLHDLLVEDGTPAVIAGRVRAVVADWRDERALANVLMYPGLIPDGMAVPALVRGLGAPEGDYLRLAAAVGAGDLPVPGSTAARVELVEALLDLIASDPGTAAARASVSIGSLVQRDDAPDLVTLLAHPSPVVRRNLAIALLELLGPDDLAEVLADREQVSDQEAAAAAAVFAAEGIDPHRTAASQRLLPVLAHIPDPDGRE